MDTRLSGRLPAGGRCDGPNCGKAIAWATGPKNGKMPLDPAPADPPEGADRRQVVVLVRGARHCREPSMFDQTDGDLYMPHWATCPDREMFKR